MLVDPIEEWFRVPYVERPLPQYNQSRPESRMRSIEERALMLNALTMMCLTPLLNIQSLTFALSFRYFFPLPLESRKHIIRCGRYLFIVSSAILFG